MAEFKKKDIKKIEKEVKIFFEKLCFPVQTNVSFKDEILTIDLQSEEPRILIGERGKALSCIQRVLKAILQKKFEDHFYFNVDINDYKKKKAKYLKEMANEVADRVVLTKEEVALEPMSSYERRVIHLELVEREDVVTESRGQEPERRVVVKPA